MPMIQGPKHRVGWPGRPDEGLSVQAATLGEALAAYEAEYAVEIIESNQHDGRYFIHRDLVSGEEEYVDIHVLRVDGEHCVRQDRDFPLCADDAIVLGMLVC
ncbi:MULTISPECIES: hypothetical protein [Lysobacter]|uniref:hypothetical protein n=1 Tax=Lysobacter TaxID=68 RepID=UPI001F2E502F|nr:MULTISPECIES: hypothetical protein [Lysobacter]UJB17747.1 hypothetical protein L1A79_15405 [Lysobacter capsici]UJQ28531.1 hypothetical protein L2D09_24485 [Lysobacter gummosus]